MLAQEEAARSVAGYESQEKNSSQRSISLSFSLQILSGEGLSVKGDASMQRTSTGIPPRASRPADTTDEYDDQLPGAMPKSQLRWKPTNQVTAGQDVTATTTVQPVTVTSNRISGSTRTGLIILLLLCIAFLVNGIVVPALVNLGNQLRYGDARIARYDIGSKHWITEDDRGKIRVYIVNGQHVQVLDSVLGGSVDHALVTLTDEGNSIEVSVNGVQAAQIVSDGHGGYKWGSN